MAPMIRFLAIPGEMPRPLSMNGTSLRLVYSAFSSCLLRCASWLRSFYIIFPRYLYSFTFLSFLLLYQISPSSVVMHSVLSTFSSMLKRCKSDSSSCRFLYILSKFLSTIAISSANARMPTYSPPKHIPLLCLMNSCIIF